MTTAPAPEAMAPAMPEPASAEPAVLPEPVPALEEPGSCVELVDEAPSSKADVLSELDDIGFLQEPAPAAAMEQPQAPLPQADTEFDLDTPEEALDLVGAMEAPQESAQAEEPSQADSETKNGPGSGEFDLDLDLDLPG